MLNQRRGFFNDDIYSLESLYQYLKSFKIEVVKQSLYIRGGGKYWTDVNICFRYIDNYICRLISNALGVKFIISENTTKVVNFKLEFDKNVTVIAHAIVPNLVTMSQKYREQIEMKLMIHVFRALI